ncbi:hypothetical protein [Flavobacterium sp. '19STA2R22 D10 B1']|uniref:hypothetical protein n=1 Tax=Flavobacterium aerium TaxID=3037261 RepID=UPI00278BB5ED|nr:hypothetical protein [Flavobacterium sp. '19STA2R22 D10 B1']
MELHLKIIGSLLMLLALLHIPFPKYFNWHKELNSLSLINKQMMEYHTFFIALMLLLMGALCLTSAQEIVETPLGRQIALGFALFWIIRLIVQFFGYSSKLWRGKKFETIVHIVFSLFWIYMSTVFILIYLA